MTAKLTTDLQVKIYNLIKNGCLTEPQISHKLRNQHLRQTVGTALKTMIKNKSIKKHKLKFNKYSDLQVTKPIKYEYLIKKHNLAK